MSGLSPGFVAPSLGPKEYSRDATFNNSMLCNSISFVHFNIRGFLSHVDELHVVLADLGKPGVVGLTETFLDESVKDVFVAEYVVISRRDRNRHGGGILLLAHVSVVPHIVHTANSLSYEISWHILHTDQGAVNICLWYGPPRPGETYSITSFDDELAMHSAECAFTVIFGDMNVHNIEWLAHSSVNGVEGR